MYGRFFTEIDHPRSRVHRRERLGGDPRVSGNVTCPLHLAQSACTPVFPRLDNIIASNRDCRAISYGPAPVAERRSYSRAGSPSLFYSRPETKSRRCLILLPIRRGRNRSAIGNHLITASRDTPPWRRSREQLCGWASTRDQPNLTSEFSDLAMYFLRELEIRRWNTSFASLYLQERIWDFVTLSQQPFP